MYTFDVGWDITISICIYMYVRTYKFSFGIKFYISTKKLNLVFEGGEQFLCPFLHVSVKYEILQDTINDSFGAHGGR